MAKLRKNLVEQLQKIKGVEERSSIVAGGSALFFKNKEIAHFHSNNELDVRLTRKVIKSEKLVQPTDSVHHHNRGPGSEWIELRFRSQKQVDEVVRLFKLATKQYQ